MDATRKKEARTTKNNMAKDTDGGSAKYGALIGAKLRSQQKTGAGGITLL